MLSHFLNLASDISQKEKEKILERFAILPLYAISTLTINFLTFSQNNILQKSMKQYYKLDSKVGSTKALKKYINDEELFTFTIVRHPFER